MNVLALCVVYASLVTAGFFTPSPEKHNSKDDVRVNKGVLIGLETDDGNTKVSISPHEVEVDATGFVANAKEKIGSYMGRTKEAAEKAANGAAETVSEAEEAVRGAIGKAKDTVAHTAHKASEKAQETKERVKEAASETSSNAKDKVTEKAGEMKEGVKEKVKEKAKEAQEKVKNEGKKGSKGVLRRCGGVLAYMVSPVRKAPFTGVLHLLGFAVAYGMSVWVTFASNYVLAKVLPRQQFAMVQSKMYPVYFKAMASSVGLALLGHMMDRRRRFSPLGLGIFRDFDLMASLVMSLVNLLHFEPRATKVMFERMKKEKEEGDATVASGGSAVDSTTAGGGATATELEKRKEAAAAKPQNVRSSGALLRRLNSDSSLLNVATLMCLTWHLVRLGHHLHAVC